MNTGPEIYPLESSPDGRAVRLVELDEAAYRAASFLDGRLLAQAAPPASSWRNWGELEAAPPQPFHMIFHLGHVGSTLLSRLLGEHAALFALREPALLRELAQGSGRSHMDVILALLARTWRGDQTAIIKATSFVSQIGPELMARSLGGRAILLTLGPGAYLRTLLAGAASGEEANRLYESRKARLETRLGRAPDTGSFGERLALGWLSELLSLQAIADALPGRWLWLDFDHLLAEPASVLKAAFAHLRANPEEIDLAGLVRGPLLQRYSKAPEHAYSPELRHTLLQEAQARHGEEVRRGLGWLQATAQAYPQVRPALLNAAAATRGPLAAPLAAT